MSDEDIIWIPTGLASRIIGCCASSLFSKYQGSIRHYYIIGKKKNHCRWCLDDCKKLSDELKSNTTK